MTEVNIEHLKKVYVICETESDKEKAEQFLENNRCIGMSAHLFDDEIDPSEQIKEYNIAVADTGNKTFIEDMVIRYKDVGYYIRIFEIN